MGNEKFTFFWIEGPFSQWSNYGFKLAGKKYGTNEEWEELYYNCAEQWMMACKARHFGDVETFSKIMKTDNPREQKKLGRQVKGFSVNIWSKVACQYVYEGNVAKFIQNPEARRKLFETVGTTLVEASPKDIIWGIGLGSDDPDALDRSKWKGLNWLGETLTKVRDDLIALWSKRFGSYFRLPQSDNSLGEINGT